MNYNFGVVLGYWDALADGLWLTSQLTVLCAILGSALGFGVSLARVSKSGL